MSRADEAGAAQTHRALPALAHEQRACPQLRDGSGERERLEPARGRVIIQVQIAHPRSRRSLGSESIKVLRSAERSTVVTRVRPSRVTTTRSRTPYNTTAFPSACTTLPLASSACTRPLAALPDASCRRTRCSAAHV